MPPKPVTDAVKPCICARESAPVHNKVFPGTAAPRPQNLAKTTDGCNTHTAVHARQPAKCYLRNRGSFNRGRHAGSARTLQHRHANLATNHAHRYDRFPGCQCSQKSFLERINQALASNLPIAPTLTLLGAHQSVIGGVPLPLSPPSGGDVRPRRCGLYSTVVTYLLL